MTTPLIPSLASLVLLHGEGRMDLIYFWSSILIVLLPLAVFGTLAYLVVKGSRRAQRAGDEARRP